MRRWRERSPRKQRRSVPITPLRGFEWRCASCSDPMGFPCLRAFSTQTSAMRCKSLFRRICKTQSRSSRARSDFERTLFQIAADLVYIFFVRINVRVASVHVAISNDSVFVLPSPILRVFLPIKQQLPQKSDIPFTP